MDDLFWSNLDTLLCERHSIVLASFRKENENHCELCKEIQSYKDKIKVEAPDSWEAIQWLIELLELKEEAEGKYLYTQGMKDWLSMFHFAQNDFINSEYRHWKSRKEAKK